VKDYLAMPMPMSKKNSHMNFKKKDSVVLPLAMDKKRKKKMVKDMMAP